MPTGCFGQKQTACNPETRFYSIVYTMPKTIVLTQKTPTHQPIVITILAENNADFMHRKLIVITKPRAIVMTINFYPQPTPNQACCFSRWSNLTLALVNIDDWAQRSKQAPRWPTIFVLSFYAHASYS